MLIRNIRTHEDNSGGYKYISFSIEEGVQTETLVVHIWL